MNSPLVVNARRGGSMTYRSNLLPQLKEAQAGHRMNEVGSVGKYVICVSGSPGDSDRGFSPSTVK